MSRPARPELCTLTVGLILSRDVATQEVLDALAELYASPSSVSPEVAFPGEAYYQREMGPGLRRLFVALEGRWDPGWLASLKLRSNALEARWADQGRRRVNLDPGLVDLGHLVLASGKPAAHRVYLGRGIYAEVEYLYQGKTFRPLPWTYLDYCEPEAIQFFNRLRESHKKERKEAP